MINFFKKLFDTDNEKLTSRRSNNDEKQTKKRVYPMLANQSSSILNIDSHLTRFYDPIEPDTSEIGFTFVYHDSRKNDWVEGVKSQLLSEESLSKLISTAFENLDKFEIEIGELEHSGSGVFGASGICASEIVLSNNQMNKIHERLVTNRLVVSIPAQGHIFIRKEDATEEEKELFLNYHYTLFQTSKKDDYHLSENFFHIEDGNISGIAVYTPK